MVFDQGDASFSDIWHGDSSWPVHDALWHLVVLGPMALGFLAAVYRLEVEHTTLAFVVPGLRSGMSAGMLAVGLPVAAMLALLMGRIAPLSAAIAALALAMFWFLVPGVSIDAALPLPARLLAGIVIVGGWASSGDVGVDYSAEGWLGPVAEARPILTSLVALGCAAALLWLQASPILARRRPFLWSRLAPSRAQSLYWVQQRHSRRAWRTGLVTERRGPWLRAAVYESAGFAHGYMSPPAIGALVVIWLEMPAWLWLFAGLGFTQRGLQLSTTLLYPLSRIRRAELAPSTGSRCAATSRHATSSGDRPDDPEHVTGVRSLRRRRCATPKQAVQTRWSARQRAPAGSGLPPTPHIHRAESTRSSVQ